RPRIRDRDRVVELLPAGADLDRLDVQPGLPAGDPHPDRGPHGAGVQAGGVVEVALRHRQHLVCRRTPAVADDPELAFDLDRHRYSPGSNIAIDSTCPVCGNMSITPAARSFQPFSLTRKP